MNRFFLFSIFLLVLITGSVFGRSKSREGSVYSRPLKTSVRKAQASLPMSGVLDIRPSWNMSEKKWFAENLGELGVKTSPTFYLGYRQHFTTNIDNNNPPDESGLNPKMGDGLFRFSFEKIYSSPKHNFSINYEPRLYLPTDASKRDKGYVGSLRNYFIFDRKINDTFGFAFWEVPILHWYKGDPDSEGILLAKGSSNPAFENRFYVKPYFTWGDGLWSLYFLLKLQNTKMSSPNEDEENLNNWAHEITLNPELTFTLTQSVSLGLSFETGSFIQSDFSNFDIGNAFEKGVSQFVFTLSF